MTLNSLLPIQKYPPFLPAEAIAYAQANGQGQLTVAADGSTTNRFGEKMVFDSSGNLAPCRNRDWSIDSVEWTQHIRSTN